MPASAVRQKKAVVSKRAAKAKDRAKKVPAHWKANSSNSECSLHQLSPYIGKLKSVIARELIEKYSKPNDIVVDPFCGSGTVLLEALLRGRRAYGLDISPYARVLTQGKLFAPVDVAAAQRRIASLLKSAFALEEPDLRQVPSWVREFFHPRTLKETLRFAEACKNRRDYFSLACLLGILHHQRPGFLSFPSSHLVPYLRDKKFPKRRYPQLYEYRDLESRIYAKIERAYRRTPPISQKLWRAFDQTSVERAEIPVGTSLIVTSPPYMNALDYGRDNRLRLWLINQMHESSIDRRASQEPVGFEQTMRYFANNCIPRLRNGGVCVVIVGEQTNRKFKARPVDTVVKVFEEEQPRVSLVRQYSDEIPDIRRARRELRGVRTENFLVFKKRSK